MPLERITHIGSISIDDRVGARSGAVAGSRDGSRHRRSCCSTLKYAHGEFNIGSLKRRSRSVICTITSYTNNFSNFSSELPWEFSCLPVRNRPKLVAEERSPFRVLSIENSVLLQKPGPKFWWMVLHLFVRRSPVGVLNWYLGLQGRKMSRTTLASRSLTSFAQAFQPITQFASAFPTAAFAGQQSNEDNAQAGISFSHYESLASLRLWRKWALWRRSNRGGVSAHKRNTDKDRRVVIQVNSLRSTEIQD